MLRIGEKGFTLIELLIVVAILGVLAAIVVPNVGRFLNAGQREARATELSNVQSAITSMMVDNNLAMLPHPVDTSGNATKDMAAFPDLSVCGTEKLRDALGNLYVHGVDKDGYILYQHDRIAGSGTDNLTNYTVQRFTSSYYTVDAYGTVSQWADAAKTPY